MGKLLIVALAYFVTGWMGLQIPFAGSHITLVWLPTGIAVAALLRWGWAVWPGVLLGSFLTNLAIGSSVPLAMGIAAGNTLAPMLSTCLLLRAGFLPLFERQKDVGWFVVAAAVGMLVSATGGCASLSIAGILPPKALGSAWLSWWMGDTVGVLLAAPLLLGISRESLNPLRQVHKELLAWMGCAGLVAWFAFFHAFEQSGGGLPFAFLPIPLLVWAALRFGNIAAAMAGLFFSIFAAWSTAHGHGPFILADVQASLVLLWSFMTSMVLIGLLILALQTELRLYQQRYSTAFNSCPVAASIARAEDGRFLEVNDNYQRDFGWSKADLIGKTSVEVGVWPDEATRAPWVQAIRSAGRLVNHETVWLHKNDERRHVSLSAEITKINGKDCILAYATDITAQKQAEQVLAASEIRLRAVLNGVQSGVVVIGENGCVESFNHSAEQMFGYRAEEVIGHNVKMLMPEPYQSAHDGYLADFQRTGVRKVIGHRREVLGLRKDGTTFPIELGVTETLLSGAKGFIGSVSDISFRRAAEAELRIAATAFESREGMIVTNPQGVILRVNKAFTDTTGYSAEEAIGQSPSLLKSGRHDANFYRAMWQCIHTTGRWQGEIWDRRKNGTEYPKWLTISAVFGDDGAVTHYVGTHQDITERKIAEERINELAYFDPLTRLPNRTLLLDRLKQAMTACTRSDCYGALLFIDLDNFKTLNDTLGHDTGDILLQQVAQRIAGSVREGDTVARLGGDEFVVVLAGLSSTADDAATQTKTIGEKILSALHRSYVLHATEYRSSASIGATLFKGHQTSIDDLMKQADLAMYKSKQTGRNALHFFDPVMQSLLMERTALETSLRRAIEDNQFVLHYQAQVADAGRITGVEALVRWQHPERGMVPPDQFIPLAEENGLILPLGQWVLATACAQLAQWAARERMAHLTMAVNVSAKEFREPDFVAKVLTILEQTGANPKNLKLELTESLLVDNLDSIVEKMFALRAKGIGFSLDDFGTGYSSLSYLKRLPLDQLKIDQSFVRDVLVDPNDAAIAKTIVALAQSLGLGVIAEGVETEAQRLYLSDSGCHAYQGYLFSRPLPLEAFEAFMRRA